MALDLYSILPWALAVSASVTVLLLGNLFLGPRAANDRQVKRRLNRVGQQSGRGNPQRLEAAARRQ